MDRTKTIVGVSLVALAVHTVAHEGVIGHGLPSAFIMASPAVAASTASVTSVMVTPDFVMSFGSASTEAIYPGVPDSKPLKSDGQVQLPMPPKPGPKA